MKKAIIVLTALFILNGLQAQTIQVTDTLAYLKTIEADKSKFVGKSFSVLLDSLKIKVQYFSPRGDVPHDMAKETSTAFRFNVPTSVDDFKTKYVLIYWYPYLDARQSSVFFDDAPDGANWTTKAIDFYKKGVIKDIKVY